MKRWHLESIIRSPGRSTRLDIPDWRKPRWRSIGRLETLSTETCSDKMLTRFSRLFRRDS